MIGKEMYKIFINKKHVYCKCKKKPVNQWSKVIFLTIFGIDNEKAVVVLNKD